MGFPWFLESAVVVVVKVWEEVVPDPGNAAIVERVNCKTRTWCRKKKLLTNIFFSFSNFENLGSFFDRKGHKCVCTPYLPPFCRKGPSLSALILLRWFRCQGWWWRFGPMKWWRYHRPLNWWRFSARQVSSDPRSFSTVPSPLLVTRTTARSNRNI